MSHGHRASRNANTHDEIPNDSERPEQRADHEQPERAIREPRLVAPQMNVSGIEGRNPCGAESDDSDQELARGDGERCEKASDQNDSKPTFGGECECVLHGDGVKWPNINVSRSSAALLDIGGV